VVRAERPAGWADRFGCRAGPVCVAWPPERWTARPSL